MIDDAPILKSTRIKAAYSLVRSRLMCPWRKNSDCRTKTHFPGIWTNKIFASKQALNHMADSELSISARITIPFLNSSWRKKSLTLVLAMDSHDAAAAVASFTTVKSHFEYIMVSPTAPASPSIGRPKRLPKHTSNTSSTRTNDKKSI